MANTGIFQKQLIMRKVCYALIPLLLYSIFLYGFRPIYQLAVAFIFGILTEYIFERSRNKKTTEAVLVTCFLYGLSLPPNLPIWMNIVGIVFAVFITKCIFGGFGRNVYNPAISGRLFIYLAFPSALTTLYWQQLSTGASALATSIGSVDVISSATPLVLLREGTIPPLWNLFFGLRLGSLGEGCILLLILSALYLLYTRTADWKLIVSTMVSATVFLSLFYALGLIKGFTDSLSMSEGVSVVSAYLMSGSLVYVAVFMSTDPVSGPNNVKSKWVYGCIIGASTIVIRLFSGFPEGVSFAVMIANTFACLLDEAFAKKKVVKKPVTSTSTPTTPSTSTPTPTTPSTSTSTPTPTTPSTDVSGTVTTEGGTS